MGDGQHLRKMWHCIAGPPPYHPLLGPKRVKECYNVNSILILKIPLEVKNTVLALEMWSSSSPQVHRETSSVALNSTTGLYLVPKPGQLALQYQLKQKQSQELAL